MIQTSRLFVLQIIMVVILSVLAVRLYNVQLIENDSQRYGNNLEISTTRYVLAQPRRGEILANDGRTLLAESVPIFSLAVLPDRLPSAIAEPERRNQVLGRVVQIAEMTSTITISPMHVLDQQPALHEALTRVVGEPWLSPVPTEPPPINTLYQPLTDSLKVQIAPDRILEAVDLTRTYSDVLSLENPVEPIIRNSNARRYETVIIKEDIPHELTLAVRENSAHLPGVVVVDGYKRLYPQSGSVQSLSHFLGYVGRVNQCELVMENPSESWLAGLLDVVSHAPSCGVLRKQATSSIAGIPLYQREDRIGKDGLEGSYEVELRGELGVKTLLVDALDRPVSDERVMRPVRNGNNLILTIDLTFQQQVETVMRRWLAESERRRQESPEPHKQKYPSITNGAAVVFDVRDGRILAMTSFPTYDNNIWVDPERSNELIPLLSPADEEAWKELIRLATLTNRTIAGLYPPGSSFKQFVGSIALHHQVVNRDTKLRDPGLIVLQERGGQQFVLPNSTRVDNGEIDIVTALKVSSNVFFASIAGGNDQASNLRESDYRIEGMGIDRLSEGLQWFGFGQPTGVRLPGETRGLIPTPTWKAHNLRGEPWTTGDTYNMSIGQGYVQTTPLQLAMSTASVANGGTLYLPQMVQQITSSSGDVVADFQAQTIGHVPIDPAHLAVMREGMRLSVTEGANVAARPDCSGLNIAGKTGTAEFGPIIEREDGSQTRRSHSWFVGFAPYEDPQIAVVVLLEGTGDLNDGSSTLAVPAVTQIMQQYFGVSTPEEIPEDCPKLPE
ncbi:MAG: peptidoglycan glycosyltransferase [Chloroflexaceae bacterium]|nr:peptidoglycan glycosyltransferase [Chloroflexaceae bacterium]